MRWKVVLVVLVIGLVGWLATMGGLSLLARRPDGLGAKEGRLAPCPGSPNCVSSGDERESHSIAPLRFSDAPEAAWARLGQVLANLPRTRVVSETETYRHVECTSRVFRFVDDLELLLDPGGKRVHVRSASRAGRSDLGVNRQRVEAIRRAFEDQ